MPRARVGARTAAPARVNQASSIRMCSSGALRCQQWSRPGAYQASAWGMSWARAASPGRMKPSFSPATSRVGHGASVAAERWARLTAQTFQNAKRDATRRSAASTMSLYSASTGRVCRKGATRVTSQSISGRAPRGHTRGRPSATALSTRPGWRCMRTWVRRAPHEMPTMCARPAGTRVSMSSARRSVIRSFDGSGRWLLRPKPGRSGARQWKPASSAMCRRHSRPL